MADLRKVRAADLMQRDVICLKVDSSIEEAIETFEDCKISGAPVVDASEELVGVLSLADVARAEHLRGGRIEAQRGDYYFSDPTDDEFAAEAAEDDVFGREDYDPEVLGRELVKDWLNPQVISLPPSASIREICELMVREKVHRIFVVEGRSLRGIISTFDIVQHLAENL